MKIAILDIDNLKNPHWGSGAALVTREVAKRLVSKNHIVTVYTSKYPGWKDYIEDGINYLHIGLGSNNSVINNIFYILSIPFTVSKIKANVIIESFTAPISTCFSPLFTKIPVVGLSQFYAADKMVKKYHLRLDLIEKYGSKIYKYFIACNQDDEKKMKKYNKSIYSTEINNGVNPDYFKMNTNESNYILFIGRLDLNQKGIDLLLESYNQIKDKIEEDLLIMGGGSIKDVNSISSIINKYGLAKRIKLIGKKSGKEKDQILAKSKITVFPSRYEGQSIAAIESLALGKPFVCFDIPGFSWLNSDYTLKSIPFNVNSFSNNILLLLSDDKKRLALSAKIRKHSKKFSWDVSAQKYELFLNKVLNMHEKK